MKSIVRAIILIGVVALIGYVLLRFLPELDSPGDMPKVNMPVPEW